MWLGVSQKNYTWAITTASLLKGCWFEVIILKAELLRETLILEAEVEMTP
jgi:hypothetical protein